MTETISKRAAFFAIALAKQFYGGFKNYPDQSSFAKTVEESEIVKAMIEMGAVAEQVFLRLPEETRDELGSDFTTFLLDRFDFEQRPVPRLAEDEEEVALWFVEEFDLDGPSTKIGM